MQEALEYISIPLINSIYHHTFSFARILTYFFELLCFTHI
nr:MAG TPA: hypothetical protein [Caudoviricetes sp.]